MVSQDKIVVVGLGYVGIPVATLLADRGYEVLGIDVDSGRVADVNAGRFPLKGIEPELPEMMAKVVGSGRLRATTSFKECEDARTVLVCVDTPIDVDNKPNNEALESAARQIGENISPGTLVIVESTVAPARCLGLSRM